MIDPLTTLAFSLYENRGVYALLLGSGVSRAAQIPTGWEITLELVRRVAALEGVTEQPDWAVWHKERFGGQPSYSELLDQLSTTPDERRSILHSYIEPSADDLTEGRKTPTRAHHAIARLVQAGFIRVIITTNFDRLIENALREVGVEPTIIKSDDDLAGAVPLIHSRCYIVKLHGDYLDTRIKNTDAELSTYSAPANTLLDRIIDEHGLIICGWSAEWDPALKAAITRAPSRRYPLYWAARGQLSAVADEVIRHRAGKAIPIEDADSFFERLERMVSAQADLQKPNPRSIELLVASAKKYLPREEFRIQLDEIIGDELRIIAAAPTSQEFDPQGAWSNERFLRLIGRYEGMVEPLARIFGVIGRWGGEANFAASIDSIERLGRPIHRNGLDVLNRLNTYPGVLLFYAYGIALLKAGRYKDLYRLFSRETRIRQAEAKPLAATLLAEAWHGNEDNRWWQLLPGFEQRKTALSDHLLDIFSKWTADYIFVNSEVEPLFEEFELLGALVHTTRHERAELRANALSQKADQNFVWAPVGRAGWDNEGRRPIIENWKRAEQTQILLNAGFADGDQAFLADAIESIARLSDRRGWRY